MLDHPRVPTLFRGRWLTLAAAAFLALPALAAGQPGAATEFERVLLRDAAARQAAAPTPASLRAIAASYEVIVRRYPTSPFADVALWRGADVLRLAYARFGQAADRVNAAAMLTWLRRNYPRSPLATRELPRIDGPLASGQATDPISVTASAAAPAAAPGPTAHRPPGGGADVRAITHTPLPHGDRITIELTREVAYSADRLDDPDRIYVDLTRTAAAPALIRQTRESVSGRLVKSTRLAVHPDGTSRVVLDVTGQPRYRSFPLYNPFRLVIDVESDALARPDTPLAPLPAAVTVTTTPAPPAVPVPARSNAPAVPDASAPAATAATSGGDYSLARQLGLQVARVVIDPGHGGQDPGARANGLTEADVVLDVALQLEALLREEGVDVVLTRRTSTFVALEERAAIANRVEADLFLSIHANASPTTGTSGIETYILNLATNQEAQALAARENATGAKTLNMLPRLLTAIALNDKVAESRELANMVQSALVRALSAQRRSVKSLGVKQAPFVVLIGAEMPSILVEIGFLTNRSEATTLEQRAGREAVAHGLLEAVLQYQAALKRTPELAGQEDEVTTALSKQ